MALLGLWGSVYHEAELAVRRIVEGLNALELGAEKLPLTSGICVVVDEGAHEREQQIELGPALCDGCEDIVQARAACG